MARAWRLGKRIVGAATADGVRMPRLISIVGMYVLIAAAGAAVVPTAASAASTGTDQRVPRESVAQQVPSTEGAPDGWPKGGHQIAQLTGSDIAARADFGGSVALSTTGTVAVVGADAKGAAYVFRRREGAWTQIAELTPSDPSGDDAFGYSVAVSSDGSTIAVGAFGHNNSTGAVYVFTRHHKQWRQTALVTASDGAVEDRFGDSVSLSGSGTTLLIGAWHHTSSGAAYVFTGHGRRWEQSAEMTVTEGGCLGQEVALSADASTALLDDGCVSEGGLTNSGAAFVFSDDGQGWTQAAELTASDPQEYDGFGQPSISGDGSVAIVGALGHDGNTGAAYVFARGTQGWAQAAELTASDGSAGALFGQSVAISTDGSTVGVGAPGYSAVQTGAVYVFRLGKRWTQSAKLGAADGGPGNQFGCAEAISADGSRVLIGALAVDSYEGAAYIFRR